jgi:hypothetical protein
MSLVKGKANIPFKSNGSKERVTDPKQTMKNLKNLKHGNFHMFLFKNPNVYATYVLRIHNAFNN